MHSPAVPDGVEWSGSAGRDLPATVHEDDGAGKAANKETPLSENSRTDGFEAKANRVLPQWWAKSSTVRTVRSERPWLERLESSFSRKAIAGRTKMGAIVQEGTNSWTFVSTLVDGIATTVQKAREDMQETNSERRRGDIKIQPEDFDEYYKMDREGHYSPCAFIHVRAATHPVAYCGRSETRKQPGRIQEM
jgi:hypothetical protein